jgi:hypothetical protein
MLIYARIILIIMILQSIGILMGGLLLIAGGSMIGAVLIPIGGVLAYLAYSSFVEVSACAAQSQQPQLPPRGHSRSRPRHR